MTAPSTASPVPPTPDAAAPPAARVAGAGLAQAVAGPDPALVEKLAAQLQECSLQAVHDFGRDIGHYASRHVDQMLEQVRSKDLDTMGQQLTQVVVAAKSLNLHSLSDRRSRVPLVGVLIDRMRVKSAAVAVKFQDVRVQVESLLGEVQTTQRGLATRVDALEDAFESVKSEHALLGAYIEAGNRAMERFGRQLAVQDAQAAGDPLAAQGVQDLRAATAALEKRVADFKVLQHSALQQLPMIRMVQANNRMLIEKFHTIKELTVPAWKRQFTLALSLNEQKNAVGLANAIDDATNDFLRENAKLLKENTVATARANQRLVIDVATLQQVHETLMSTVQEVLDINREGIEQRNSATAQLQAMRTQLVEHIGAA